MREVADAEDRLAFLDETAKLLWPRAEIRFGANAASRIPPASTTREFRLVGHRRTPRLLVPAGRSTGAAAIRAHGSRLDWRTRTRSSLFATAFLLGSSRAVSRRVLVEVVDGSETIEDVLAEALGESVRVAVHLTSRRYNRKPILQALDSRGVVRAFVKVGANRLGAELVRREHRALTALAEAAPRSFRLPRVMSCVEWNGVPLLLLEPATPRGRRPPETGSIHAAEAELSELGSTSSSELGSSSYWRQTRQRIAGLRASVERAGLDNLADRLEQRYGDVILRFGGSHGDWAPWNMALASGSLLVWDWERFDDDIPVGFDALHYRFSESLIRRGRSATRSAGALPTDAADVLRRFGQPQASAGGLAAGYLLALALRRVSDADASGTGGADPLGESLTAAIGSLLESS